MTSSDPAEVLTRPAPEPDRTLRYGDGPHHVIDLRLPPPSAGERRPVVVVVHGGFWRARYDRRHTGPQADALARLGYVVAVPEYRRVGQPGGGWPGTFDDTAAWSDTVVDLVCAELGDGTVDRDCVALIGHSAGGHLALWAASRHRLSPSSPWHRATPIPVRGVVSLAGVTDLALAATMRLGDGAPQGLLGGEPDAVPQRYAQADPARLLPSGIRTALLHGNRDETVPPALSRAYAEAASAAGDDARLTELPETGHFEVIDPLSPAWPSVLAAIDHLCTGR